MNTYARLYGTNGLVALSNKCEDIHKDLVINSKVGICDLKVAIVTYLVGTSKKIKNSKMADYLQQEIISAIQIFNKDLHVHFKTLVRCPVVLKLLSSLFRKSESKSLLLRTDFTRGGLRSSNRPMYINY